MIFIDSNVWCYYFDKSSKEHEKVSGYLEKAFSKEEICVNTVTLMEVSHFLFKNLGAIRGKEKLNILTSLPIEIIDFNYGSFNESVSIFAEHLHTGIGGRDSTILAAMKEIGANELVTHDKAFERVEGIKVIDPVEN